MARAVPSKEPTPDDGRNAGADNSLSTGNLKKAAVLVQALVKEGENPSVLPRSTMWDPWALATWYGNCRTLSALLGKDNPWASILCSWDSTKGGDPAFHIAMLGTLRSIAQYLEV
jgi:hypothetical protein